MQKSNRSRILKFLAKNKYCTRVELSKETGLTQAAITKIIAEMIQSGIVSETGLEEGKNGRRAISISLNADKYEVMGVKITRKSFDVAVFDFHGKLLQQVHEKTNPSLGARYTMERIQSQMLQMMKAHPKILSCGIAVPGPFLQNEGRIAVMSEFSGWEQINISSEFSKNMSVPVYIEHDANAGALSLWRNRDNEQGVLVHFLASEGIGAGIVVDGQIIRGVNGTAGEVGHMSIDYDGPRCTCGNRGCLEGYCSALAFAKHVQALVREDSDTSLSIEDSISAETVFRHAKAGDKLSIKAVRDVGKWIGCGIANIIYIYNPDDIIITDIMTGGGEIMLDAIRETVKQRVLPEIYQGVTIRMERPEIDPILAGAAVVAIEHILEDFEIETIEQNFPVRNSVH